MSDPNYKVTRRPAPEPPPYQPVEPDPVEAALFEEASALQAARENQ